MDQLKKYLRMGDSENVDIPFGVGWLSGVEEEHLEFCLLLLEIIIFTLLGGVSWYLLIFSLFIYFGSSFKHQCVEIVKKITLFFLPRVEETPAHEEDIIVEVSKAAEEEMKVSHAKEEKDKTSLSPSFIKPDGESVGWINDIIEKLWEGCLRPIVSTKNLNDLVVAIAEGFEDEDPKIASLLRQISVVKMNIGSCPLQISRIVSHTDESDERN